MFLTTVEFTNRGVIYEQKHGLPMGGSLSPVIAELVMQELERDLMEQCALLDIVPKVWLRMVDDVFAVGKGAWFEKWKCLCNSYDVHLQFTTELEIVSTKVNRRIKTEQFELPFLDVLVRRQKEGGCPLVCIENLWQQPM